MCNRYHPPERNAIVSLFGAIQLRDANPGPSIVHPREPAWVVRRDDARLVMEQMSWGFPVVLRGARGTPLKPKPVNNARFDKLGTFWKRWATQPANRCLIPATAYAEAVGPSGSMLTTWLSLRSTPVFAWAGLWDDSAEWGRVMTGVMTENAPELAPVHDRSPVIIAREDWDAWLADPFPGLARFDRPWPADDVRVVHTDVLWREGGREQVYGTATPWSA